jgi:hypothetical protein
MNAIARFRTRGTVHSAARMKQPLRVADLA